MLWKADQTSAGADHGDAAEQQEGINSVREHLHSTCLAQASTTVSRVSDKALTHIPHSVMVKDDLIVAIAAEPVQHPSVLHDTVDAVEQGVDELMEGL